MEYDFYNTDNFYKPKLAVKARDRLHRLLFRGLDFRSVLEVGIGFGELADYCRRQNLGWAGIDANQNLIEKIRQQGFTAYQARMPRFPEIEEKPDLLFAGHFIEHLKDYSEALDFLKGGQEVLKKSGGRYLVLLYPDIEKIGHFFWQDYTHSFVTTKKRIEDMLYDTGWKIRRSGHYTACFFATSAWISAAGKIFPYFLLPPKVSQFARLSFQRHAYTVAEV